MLRNAGSRWNEETMTFYVNWEDPDGNLRSLEISEDNEIPPKVLYVNLVQIGTENPLKAYGQVLDYIYANKPCPTTVEGEEGVSDESVAPEPSVADVPGVDRIIIPDEEPEETELPEVEEEEPGLLRSVRELPGVDVVVIPEPEPEVEEIPPEESVEDVGELPGDVGR